MSAKEFIEWQAYYKLLAEQRRKAELAAKAEAGLHKNRRGF